MYNFLLFAIIINAILVVLVILMQSDEGGGISSTAFGGAGSSLSSTFGSRESANFLNKATFWLVVSFFVLSITIALASSANFGSEKKGYNSVIMEMESDSPAAKLPPLNSNNVDAAKGDDKTIKLPKPKKNDGESKKESDKKTDK